MSPNTKMTVEERLETLQSGLAVAEAMNERLKEELRWNAMLAGEDIGWAKIFGTPLNEDRGPSLTQIREWSQKLREGLGNVHLARGLKLRRNNIWEGGIKYSNLPSGSGVKVQTLAFTRDPQNIRCFFGMQARHERESALYTDGIYLVLGDPKDHSLETLSLEDIGDIQVHPRRTDEVIAYRYDYIDYSKNNGQGDVVLEWHYTDLAYAKKDEPGYKLRVEPDETAPDDRVIFDQMVNTQIGWRFGVPDSMTAYAWAKVYRDFVMNGTVMASALAQFAFTVATGSKKETENVVAKLSQEGEAGSSFIGSNVLNPVNTAGKSYDFDAGRPLAALIASALEVSVISLTSDPGTAGSSYGSAQTLDLPTKLAIQARRDLHIEFDRRVLIWMGAKPELLEVEFGTLDDSTDSYRSLQALVLALSTGMFDPVPIANAIGDLLGFTAGNVPKNWMDIHQKFGSSATTASPGQGKTSPSGKSGTNGNDIRSDTQTK